MSAAIPKSQAAALSCPACRVPIAPETAGAATPTRCPHCGAACYVTAFATGHGESFPASRPETLVDSTESACFHHGQHRATAACAACGRFLCGLCVIDWRDEPYCATCLEAAEKDDTAQVRTRWVRYDLAALAVALLPLMLSLPASVIAMYFDVETGLVVLATGLMLPTVLTAPAALFLALWFRKETVSPVVSGKWGFGGARVIAAVSIVLWIGGLLVLIGSMLE